MKFNNIHVACAVTWGRGRLWYFQITCDPILDASSAYVEGTCNK